MPVGEREDRLGLREEVEIELRLAQRPRFDCEGRLRDHGCSSSSARSRDDDVGAVLAQRSACPTRSTPTTKPNFPGAAGGDSRQRVLEHGRLRGLDAERARREEERVGRGLSLQVLALEHDAVDDASNRSTIPAPSRTARQFALDETTAQRRPASRTALT